MRAPQPPAWMQALFLLAVFGGIAAAVAQEPPTLEDHARDAQAAVADAIEAFEAEDYAATKVALETGVEPALANAVAWLQDPVNQPGLLAGELDAATEIIAAYGSTGGAGAWLDYFEAKYQGIDTWAKTVTGAPDGWQEAITLGYGHFLDTAALMETILTGVKGTDFTDAEVTLTLSWLEIHVAILKLVDSTKPL